MSYVEKVLRYDDAKAGCMRSLAETLRRPLRAFRGLGRDDQDGGLALMSKPKQVFHGAGENDFQPTPPGMGFFAYCSKSLLIHDWGWVNFPKELVRAQQTAVGSQLEAENLYCLRTFGSELTFPQQP